jgi:hypothetical protein
VAESVKPGVASTGLTARKNSAVCEIVPEVPCKIGVAVPGVTFGAAASVMVCGVPGVNVNVDGDAVTPVGKPERAVTTVPLKPLIPSAVTLISSVEPATNAMVAAGPASAKSGWVVPVVSL